MVQEHNYEGNTSPLFRNSAPLMKGTLIMSLIFHVILLMGLQNTINLNWIIKPLKTYRVELFRPSIDPLDQNEAGETELNQPAPKEDTASAEDTVDTISLDTKDKRYTTYAKMIKARLALHWGKYPKAAWENLIEGDVLVLFSLNRQGHLTGIGFLNPSPHDVLNEDTSRTINASAPFPPFPDSITVNRLNIKANFTYRLTSEQ